MMIYIKTSNLFTINKHHINKYFKIFSCDDSSRNYYKKILVRENFEPDSFTISDRLTNPDFLSPSERNCRIYLRSMISSELDKIELEKNIKFDNKHSATEFIFTQLFRLLDFKIEDKSFASIIYNQEFIDVLKRLINFCLFEDPKVDIHTSKTFNEFGLTFIPIILEENLKQIKDLKVLLAFAIASGAIGLDLKGSKVAASSIINPGIELSKKVDKPVKEISDYVFNEMDRLVSKGFYFDYWNDFSNEIVNSTNGNLLWFTDDFIESFFDLFFLDKLILNNPSIRINIIPKNGQHGNDASYNDIMNFLKYPFFNNLLRNKERGKIEVHSNGPKMGAVNLKKLNNNIVDLIENSDAVFVKGCRAHELIQGGINKVSYTAFIVTREFTEVETGLDARQSPIVFLRSEPGEYSYWGFKCKDRKKKLFDDGREINVAISTTEEHETRKITNEPNVLIDQINQLSSIYYNLPDIYSTAYDQETKLIIERLSAITKSTYNRIADKYSSLRQKRPSKTDAQCMNEILEIARERKRNGLLGNKESIIKILDIGTGHGRDIQYMNNFGDVFAFGIDNSMSFIKILENLASIGKIPKNSYAEMDMRNLDKFDNDYFDVVRQNATLLHLPMLPNGIGADEAISESYRVLKKNGILFVLVKSGIGLEVTDTEEGLGGRVYQYHTNDSLEELLSRNRFKIIQMRKRYSQRPTGRVEWILAIAEK